ncbi:MAG: SDR family oxidoreductase [Actinomycetota bacterium]|nr:SDR family oxidoreductase [Actinomycetota bacterium]
MLQDRTVVVTGAGRGLGREIALTLAAEGARIVLAARSKDQLESTREAIEANGGKAAVAIADVRSEGEVTALERFCSDTFGPVDVVVCNSGIGGPSKPLWEIDRAEWDETMAVNVRGVFLCARAFLPAMIARGSGAIVVIGSMSGKRPLLNRSPYAASKTALIGLVRTLAHEVAPHGVRVNIVSPGAVEGDRMDWVIEQQAQAQGISLEAARAQFTSSSPFGRLVPASDVAAAVTFLASDRSASVTGEDLNVSAGAVMY